MLYWLKTSHVPIEIRLRKRQHSVLRLTYIEITVSQSYLRKRYRKKIHLACNTLHTIPPPPSLFISKKPKKTNNHVTNLFRIIATCCNGLGNLLPPSHTCTYIHIPVLGSLKRSKAQRSAGMFGICLELHRADISLTVYETTKIVEIAPPAPWWCDATPFKH